MQYISSCLSPADRLMTYGIITLATLTDEDDQERKRSNSNTVCESTVFDNLLRYRTVRSAVGMYSISLSISETRLFERTCCC